MVGWGAARRSVACDAAASQDVWSASASRPRWLSEATGANRASRSHSPAYDTAGVVAMFMASRTRAAYAVISAATSGGVAVVHTDASRSARYCRCPHVRHAVVQFPGITT